MSGGRRERHAVRLEFDDGGMVVLDLEVDVVDGAFQPLELAGRRWTYSHSISLRGVGAGDEVLVYLPEHPLDEPR